MLRVGIVSIYLYECLMSGVTPLTLKLSQVLVEIAAACRTKGIKNYIFSRSRKYRGTSVHPVETSPWQITSYPKRKHENSSNIERQQQKDLEASSTVAQHEVVSLPIFMCENHIYQHATTTSSTLLRSTCPPFAPGILSISQRLPSQARIFLTRATTSSPICK